MELQGIGHGLRLSLSMTATRGGHVHVTTLWLCLAGEPGDTYFRRLASMSISQGGAFHHHEKDTIRSPVAPFKRCLRLSVHMTAVSTHSRSIPYGFAWAYTGRDKPQDLVTLRTHGMPPDCRGHALHSEWIRASG